MPQQGYLPGPLFGQVPDLPQYVRVRLTPLPAPDVGYYAIGTEIVASPHDGDERLDRVVGLRHPGVSHLRILSYLHRGRSSHLQPFKERANFRVPVRPQYQVHTAILPDEPGAQPLSHTPKNANHQVRILLLKSCQFADPG